MFFFLLLLLLLLLVDRFAGFGFIASIFEIEQQAKVEYCWASGQSSLFYIGNQIKNCIIYLLVNRIDPNFQLWRFEINMFNIHC